MKSRDYERRDSDNEVSVVVRVVCEHVIMSIGVMRVARTVGRAAVGGAVHVISI